MQRILVGSMAGTLLVAASLLLARAGVREEKLALVLRELPAALLSIAGTSASALYAVGGDPNDGAGPLVLFYDGEAWRRLRTGTRGDLWWITGPIDGDYYMAGEDGPAVPPYTATRGTWLRLGGCWKGFSSSSTAARSRTGRHPAPCS